jgi:hypothetical protein
LCAHSFVFIIKIVVMQMVIGIILLAYRELREHIADAEEVAVVPTLVSLILPAFSAAY